MRETLDVVVAQSPGELVGPPARLAWLEGAVASVGDRAVDLMVLPELFVTGYHVGDRLGDWAFPRDGDVFRRIARLARDHRLAIHFRQLRFVVERFQMRHAASLAKKDHSLRPRCVVQRINYAPALLLAGCFAGQQLRIQQRGQCCRSNSGGRPAKKTPASMRHSNNVLNIHG